MYPMTVAIRVGLF